MIMDGAIALVKGKIKADGNSVELMVSDVLTPCKLYIRMPVQTDFELHDQLREYLSSTPGHVPVEAFYTDTRLYKPFPGINGITLDKKILASVKNFMGEDNVVVK